jgi:hypothetical protein
MAINSVARFDGYSYSYEVKGIDDDVIDESKKQFVAMQKKGVIKNQSYADMVWLITDEIDTCSIDFTIDEIAYEKHCKEILNCSFKNFQTSMRVLITSFLGADIKTLQKKSRAVRKLTGFLSSKENLDALASHAPELLDLLTLLPGESYQRDNLLDDLEDIFEYNKNVTNVGKVQRELAQYQSYFRFNDILAKFWCSASDDEKLLYFPIYLWWNLTSILPLRPLEFTLTPRYCINDYFLTVRRTKQKGLRLSSQYSIEKDYEKKSYKITSELIKEIKWYVDHTEQEYYSDINTLFSKETQFRLLEIKQKTESHYSYQNLRECLRSFYKNVISKQYGFEILRKGSSAYLMENEIEAVTLGDTRHIAMISLIASGGNPVICKELAGHESIEMSAHYYSNIKNFLDVLSFERYRMGPQYEFGSRLQVSEISNLTKITKGYCTSSKVKASNFSDCISAVSFDGNMLDCESCKHYVPERTSNKSEKDLRQTYDLLKYSVDQVRKGIGHEESISSSLLKFQAAASKYENNEIMKRYIGGSQL